MEEPLNPATQRVEPCDSSESVTAPETTVPKKKKGKRRERARKAKEVLTSWPSTSHDPVTQPPRSQQTQATQTDDGLLGKSTTAMGTQTKSTSTWDKSTQTPGARFARETRTVPATAPAPILPPSDQLPQDQSPPSQPDSPEQPLENPGQTNTKSKRNANELFVLTWNIDGLDQEDMDERFPGLLKYLARIRPDIVLLQELISPIAEALDEIMKDYEFIMGNTSGYFTGIALRKSRVKLLQSNVVNYPTTEQGRNLLMTQLSFSGHPLWLMTSHLESCKDNSQERMNQLRRVWKRMREAPEDHTVIFGGDTNLRDREIKRLGGLPEGISDVWEVLGQPEDCRYTWDTVKNNNKDIPFPARLRFDRVYIRPGKKGANVNPVSMKLVGQDLLKCGRYTSDHWGILCEFSIDSGLS
ncbi:tyrosyl-DNA phosphodiesterase 2 isoform X1 [Alosa sapidissima]|uniref:tyrosyl-DNA phosphodiesterase 2 isoform X1 n=2 Tax=Alosa sapidissima TaxID=34773 RepID=UPI001C09D85C|nr:tyrosyl-DNA phosphodiesterase 2 isoform X1 [Alosa sapidissima]XP_041961729.1 tyrosyl-DNA phosphodiesterase 2 isoform X1 [Alosa sapidissima]XP_041961730.1 tyrosyl-DNA phosphodiesterase 2 isoform X1 [Alosa sapidissima]XP_041961731.1 tyrosyl-DNA phosphodiesterase 2 isoform X1 [Alosa sapidissima]XP_041961732.1 tyrosyl-DNA phosphodiesterase 2 isoform X1 [Alosa sapidissima]XP_041961733.1 tyrosyl-DNA phosphodiesterase 2 isoform X1 [Alosa sapidissima]